MNQERFVELMSRKLASEASAAELRELEIYLQNNPAEQYFAEILLTYWNTSATYSKSKEADADAHFNHILELAAARNYAAAKVSSSIRPPGRFVQFSLLRVAAAAAILIALFSTAWFATRHSEKPIGRTAGIQHQFSAKRGMRSRMILPDGSIVLLNSDSKLSYPQAFSDTLREVFLDGEAFFDVIKQPKRPFIVHTSGMRIKVLGTAFNVKAYADEKTIETSLIRGSIEVSVSYRPNEKIILSPNEKLVIRSHGLPEVISSQNTIPVKPEIAINQLKPDPLDSTIAETQWTENRLVFRNESLADIARRMERWYNVTIQIKNEELKDALFSGTFTNETIDEALHALTYSKGLHYEIKEEKIVIHQ